MSNVQTAQEQQNIAHVQGMYEAFGRKDVPGILAGLAPTVKWEDHVPKQSPNHGLRQGPGEVGAFFQDLVKAVEFEHFTPTQFLGADDKVVVLGNYKGKAIPTGKHFEGSWVHVSVVKDGKVVKWDGYHPYQMLHDSWT